MYMCCIRKTSFADGVIFRGKITFANQIGDEYHYIFECTNLSEKRTSLLPKHLIERPNIIDEFQCCKNWSNNVCFILCFSHSMLLKVCVCHILEKPVSFNIFSKGFIHLISKFCCEYKWCDTLYIMHRKKTQLIYKISSESFRYNG
jgi:hypothetical protein